MKRERKVHSRNFIAFGFCLAFALSFSARGAPSAESIVRRGEARMRGDSAQALMTMKIVRSSFVRELSLRVWTQGRQKALVEILKPAKEEAITSLRSEDQMWNYLPKTDQIVRVPTSLMLQSWMGSDFTNDDLMKMSSLAEDYSHRILKREGKGKEKTVLIECTPKPTAPVVWGKILYWARQSDDLPIREEYFDEKGQLVRTLTLGGFKKMDDRVVPTLWTIQKADGGMEKTTVTYERIAFDRSIEGGVFQRDNLKNVSRNGLDLGRGWLSRVQRNGASGT